MGVHEKISHDRFPRQGELVGKPVKVCFHFDTTHIFDGFCVRDDREDPFITIFKLQDARYVLATECQYRF